MTLLEPLAAAFGMGVTELVSCRSGEPSPAPSEWAEWEKPPKEEARPEEAAVQALLDISGESLHTERKRGRQRTVLLAALAVLLLAALAVLALTLGRSVVTEHGSFVLVLAEEHGADRFVYVDQGAHLLRLRCGSGIDWHKLRESAGQHMAWQGEYRWDKRSREGELLSYEWDLSFIGRPMDEVGSATDLYAFNGDALFGYSRIMVKTLSRQPNPYGAGYLSDYIFYLGDDSDNWYLHADEELLRVRGCLGYADYGDGGFRQLDYDGDGVRELLARTVWPEKPCIVYDMENGHVTETWLDELPEEMTKPAE